MRINEKELGIEQHLFNRYGPIIGGTDLHQCLGYKSSASFNRAARLGILELPVFEIDTRRGKFALTKDVALWLTRVSSPPTSESEKH